MNSLFSAGELAPLLVDEEAATQPPPRQQRHTRQSRATRASSTGEGEMDGSFSSTGRYRRSGMHSAETLEDEWFEENERTEILRSLFIHKVPPRPSRPAHARWNAKTVSPPPSGGLLNIGNLTYAVTFGFVLALMYGVIGALLVATWVGRRYGMHCLQMARFVIWPFGRFLARESAAVGGGNGTGGGAGGGNGGGGGEGGGAASLLLSSSSASSSSSFVSRLGFLVWILIALPLAVFHVVAAIVLWWIVPYIPIAKVNVACAALLFDEPLTIVVGGGNSQVPAGSRVLLTIHHAAKLYYLRYRVMGINVVFFNLLFLAPITIGISFGFGEHFRMSHAPLTLAMCLLSIIPLASLIGAAISAISARISFAFGAVLNATFGSTIEILIFLFTMRKVEPAAFFVQKALIGSILADLLLMSSLAIIAGGLKNKEQKFNRQAAGVSSVLLLVAISGVFSPTLMYKLFGNDTVLPDKDPVYSRYVHPLSLLMASLLPVIYVIGLVFTLKTHSYLIERKHDLDEDEGSTHGEEGPEWSMKRSFITLTCCTGMVACLAETLAEVLTQALEQLDVAPGFAGLTVIAWVPALCEYINAVLFALEDNVSLSLSIATSSALQVSMIQLPALVWMQVLLPYAGFWPENVFWPVFSTVDVVVLFMAVLLTNYLSSDGRSNYLEGAAMLTVYMLALAINYCAEDYQLRFSNH